MAAPLGNTNSSSDNRLWANTIRRAVVQGDAEKLRKIADKLIELAADGDMQAIKELGDRIDGKAAQTTALTGPDGGSLKGEILVQFIGKAPGGV